LGTQFNNPEVNRQVQGHAYNLEYARHFRDAGLGSAIHYTITGEVPHGLRHTARQRQQVNRQVRGVNPGHVEATPWEPSAEDWRRSAGGGRPPTADEWNRQRRAQARNQRMKNAWGAPAPSEEQMEEDDWAEGHQAESRRQNRAAYKRNMGTPQRRPPDFSETGGTSDLKEHIESMKRSGQDRSDLRRWTP